MRGFIASVDSYFCVCKLYIVVMRTRLIDCDRIFRLFLVCFFRISRTAYGERSARSLFDTKNVSLRKNK